MKILLTNDDGFEALGIRALYDALKDDHNVSMIAPDRNRSGVSHAMTFTEPVVIEERKENIFSCSGTPVDCIAFGLSGNFVEKPDIILSGINLGPNLGTDLLYSGTAGGARQGLMLGIPSVALSGVRNASVAHFEAGAAFAARNLLRFIELLDRDHFLNINFPENLRESTPTRFTTLSRRVYDERVEVLNPKDYRGSYCFLKDFNVAAKEDPSDDSAAIKRGEIALSLVKILPEVTIPKESF